MDIIKQEGGNAEGLASPFALAQRILRELEGSGVTEQEALAAMKTAKAMLPLLRLKSENDINLRQQSVSLPSGGLLNLSQEKARDLRDSATP
jgi:hypothetical protein